MEPALRLLERYQKIPYQHRDVATIGEFKFFLEKYFTSGYDTHPILYLGFHGVGAEDKENKLGDAYVELGDKTPITLKELESWVDGRCEHRLVHFGSCGVMATHGNRLNSFVNNTGALAVCGYEEEVDWLEAAAFETLMIGRLQKRALTKSSIRAFNLELERTASGLYKRLDFRLVLKS